MNNDDILLKEKDFIFDIYHSIILNKYISYWGMPEYRIISTRDVNNEKIICYYFPCNTHNSVVHVATIGTALQSNVNSYKRRYEYIFVLPCDLGGASRQSVFNYLIDISAFTVTKEYDPHPPSLISSSSLCPHEWKAKAILFDELRGEDDNFSIINHNTLFNTDFIWAIPIHQSEYDAIKEKGISFFDQLEQSSEISIVDVTREPFC